MNLAACLGLCLGILHGVAQVELRSGEAASRSWIDPAPLNSPW